MTARHYQYAYAIIDPTQNDMCIGTDDTTNDCSGNPNYIPINPYSENYICKYYNRENGKWYVDAAKTQEWIPN